ncbi:MAG TPA: hypothetical protein VHI13_13430 [Candidatus Kapabacteria bacterium]|nr:hypothetical protein [Candidatus Kapabacteria bacterium]
MILHGRLRPSGHAIAALLLIAAGVLVSSCGGGADADPRDFYRELVEAARKHDGGFLYDVLDSARRAEVDTLIGMQMAHLDQLPPTERARWEALKGKSHRDIYSKILATDQGVAAMFAGDYKVLKVDTLIVVTVQHSGQPANVMYLRPRDGKYLVAKPPRPPGGPQGQRPDQPPGQRAPGGAMPNGPVPNGGVPNGAPREGGRPSGPASGGRSGGTSPAPNAAPESAPQGAAGEGSHSGSAAPKGH